MKRIALFALLGLSLAGNVWFLFAARGAAASAAYAAGSITPRTSASPDVTTVPTGAAASATTAATEAAAPAPLRGLVWRTPRSADDYRALADDLRAAGFPSRLINRVLTSLHSEQTLPDSPLGKAPYWQRFAVEQSKEMRAYRTDEHDQVAALLGPDGRPSARLDAIARKRQYGNLSDAKIDALGALERDYSEMLRDTYRGGGVGISDFAAMQMQNDLLNSEMLVDLAKILTPAELAEYQLHNSNAARRTATFARDVTLTAEEFAALVRARDTFDTATQNPGGTFTPEMAQQRQTAQAAYYEQMRGTLPDGRFYEILERADTSYRTIANLRSQYPSVTPAAAYQALQLQNEAQAARTTLLRNRPTPEQIQSTYATWNARLDQLLGAEAAAAYRKTQQGRAFNPPNVRRPATGTTPPKG